MRSKKSNKAVYIDTLQAYNEVIKTSSNSSFFTDDPVLAYSLNKQGVVNIDSLLSKKDNFILGDISLKIADDINEYIFSNNKIKSINYIDGLTLARPLGVLLSSLLYKALIFSRSLKIYKITEIDIYISENWNGNTHSLLEATRFGNFFSKLCEVRFFGNNLIYNIIECPLSNKEERVDSSINNIYAKAFIFPFSIILREFLNKIGMLNFLPFKKKILILGQPDGIIREALPTLNLKGYKEKIYPKVSVGVSLEYNNLLNKKDTNRNFISNKEINTSSIFVSNFKYFKQFFTNKELICIASIVDDFLVYHLSKLPKWVSAAYNYTYKIIDENNSSKIILTSALSTPISKIVHNIFRSNKYDIILFEHGVTKGISALSSKRLNTSEIYNTDHFVGYSSSSLFTLNKLIKEKKIKSCITAAPIHNKKVLLNFVQRVFWRNKLSINNKKCALIHVSPFPFSGNRRLGFGSPTETEIFEIERDFIKIYNRSNKTIFYKKYPAYRFPYNPSLKDIYYDYKNIRFLGDLDYRYIRSAFDIIVTGSPTSTFSWCLSANKPLIFFDSQIINPLINNKVRELIKKSVFYINLDVDNWKIKLDKIINLDYENILQEWKSMNFDRNIFIEKYIFCDTHNPGKKVTDYIHNLIHNNE